MHDEGHFLIASSFSLYLCTCISFVSQFEHITISQYITINFVYTGSTVSEL